MYQGYYVYISTKDIQQAQDRLVHSIETLEKYENKRSWGARMVQHNIDKYKYDLDRLLGLKIFFAQHVTGGTK